MNLMEVLMVTNNRADLASVYDVETVGLVADVVGNVEKAIEKMQNVNYEMLIYDTHLAAEDIRKLLAVAQHQLPDTFRFQMETTDSRAVIDLIQTTARRIIAAQGASIRITDGMPACACEAASNAAGNNFNHH